MKKTLRKRLMGPIFNTLDEMGELYFFGIRLQDYIKSGAMFRLQRWLGFGLCGEMSVLSMIALKHNNTARLCQGTYIKADGSNQGFHCWAEFVADGQEYIMDLTWNGLGLTWIASSEDMHKAVYFRMSENELLLDDGGKLIVKWSIDYNGFWDYELVNQLHDEMGKAKTSNIFDELTFFLSPEIKNGFLIPKDLRSVQDGRLMVPHYRFGMPLAPVIFKYFFDHPRAKKPSNEVIRKTEHAISVFDRYLKQLGIAEI
ncbi:transglutaminase domain-containing protein [Candidatus Saccharibacteria bacterium]|nr:transglutaminase domain-containing protein [Candidatus Saccharibacteria bacterium]